MGTARRGIHFERRKQSSIPTKTRKKLSYMAGPLAISPNFVLLLVRLGVSRAFASPHPRASRFLRHPDLRMHACNRIACRTSISREQNPQIPPWAMHSPAPRLRLVLGHDLAHWQEVCARTTRWSSMEFGQVSPEGFVPQGRIGAKSRTLICPLPSHDRRGCVPRKHEPGKLTPHSQPNGAAGLLITLKSPIPLSVYPCQTNRHDDDPWFRTSRLGKKSCDTMARSAGSSLPLD